MISSSNSSRVIIGVPPSKPDNHLSELAIAIGVCNGNHSDRSVLVTLLSQFSAFYLLSQFFLSVTLTSNHSNLSKAKPSRIQAFPVSLLPPRLTPCSKRVARRQTPFPLVASPLASALGVPLAASPHTLLTGGVARRRSPFPLAASPLALLDVLSRPRLRSPFPPRGLALNFC
ncbi:hypothetical protein NL676_035274 [Syzygium grande]|nr:hypothetical protein NL676_035274 [Syzygium grande]